MTKNKKHDMCIHHKVYQILFCIAMWSVLIFTIISYFMMPIPTFNPEKDYCIKWKFPDCDIKDEQKHYTFNLDRVRDCNSDNTPEYGAYVYNRCLNWTSKEEKLKQDVAELKQWKDSLKEECVENETKTT